MNVDNAIVLQQFEVSSPETQEIQGNQGIEMQRYFSHPLRTKGGLNLIKSTLQSNDVLRVIQRGGGVRVNEEVICGIEMEPG